MERLASLERGLEEARLYSRAVLAEHDRKLSELLRSKKLFAAIDRGYARHFVSSSQNIMLAESLGIPLRVHSKNMIMLGIFQLLCIAAGLALGFFAFQWYGFLLLGLTPVFVLVCWRSAMSPQAKGRFPKLASYLLVVVSVDFLLKQDWLLMTLCLTYALLCRATLWRYSYPTWVVKMLLIEYPDIAPALIDSYAVTLLRETDIAELKRRGFHV